MPYTYEQVKQSRIAGRGLTEALTAGWRPEPITVPFRLMPGESCYAQGVGEVWQFLEGEGSYVHKIAGGFGVLGIAVAAGTAMGNKNRRSQAAREAAPRFRIVDAGQLYLTNLRFAVHGQAQWNDFWHENVRMSSCDGTSVTIQMSGVPPVQLHVWPIDYFFALFHFVAYGDIIVIPAGPD